MAKQKKVMLCSMSIPWWVMLLEKRDQGVKNNKWNVVYYGYMPTLWYANGRRHRARVMPKGEWFCGVLCVFLAPHCIDPGHQEKVMQY